MEFILPLALLIYGLISIFGLLKDVNKLEHAKKWVKIPAKIMDARVVSHDKKNKTKSSKISVCFFAVYEIDGIQFGTTSVSVVDTTKASARKAVKDIELKDEVDVFYDPDNPHEACLINPNKQGFFRSYFKLGIISLLFVLSLLFLS